MSFLVTALANLGEHERMREWIERATLLDPENLNLRYNLACVMANELGDREAALDFLEFNLKTVNADSLNWMDTDTDMDAIRDHPRYRAMLAAAKERIGLGPC
jgi:adenylate cyclase